MTPAAINAFRLKSAAVQNEAHGVTVRFRNADIKVIISSVRLSLSLELGGNAQGGEYTVRFLASTLTSAPTRGEQIKFNGRKYTITETRDPIGTPGEHVVTIQPGSVSPL
ncbi:MAG: hypothetical protein RIS62_725 [Chloroflexota bacterium]|jgi:hypothetical protein